MEESARPDEWDCQHLKQISWTADDKYQDSTKFVWLPIKRQTAWRRSVEDEKSRPQLAKMPLEGSIIPVVEDIFREGAAHHEAGPSVDVALLATTAAWAVFGAARSWFQTPAASPLRRWLRRSKPWSSRSSSAPLARQPVPPMGRPEAVTPAPPASTSPLLPSPSF